jgi:hypothetical protein
MGGRDLQWTASHQCGHCRYTHLVMLEAEPRPGERFAYACPISGRENAFGYDDAMVTRWIVMARAERGQVACRKIIAS